MDKEKPARKGRKFQLNTQDDVRACLSLTLRKLRLMEVTDRELDPIRINKVRTMIYGLKTLAEMMAGLELTKLPVEQLEAELERRINAARARAPGGATGSVAEH